MRLRRGSRSHLVAEIDSAAHGFQDIIARAGFVQDAADPTPLEIPDFGTRDVATHEDDRGLGRRSTDQFEGFDAVQFRHTVVE